VPAIWATPERGNSVNTIKRLALGLVIATACIASVYLGAILAEVTLTPVGIGDTRQAETKIQVGMTKDEVRSLLGEPQMIGVTYGEDEWDYWEHRFVGSVLQVFFGGDGRVTRRQSYVD
jgi:outer membrane protein assembly factor BamE (lipoprotein component of BamABCDE complex)